MAVIANLEARYSANIISFDREIQRLQKLNQRAADRIANDHKKSVKDVNSAWAKADIGGALNKSLGNGLGNLRTQLMASIAAISSGAGIAAAVALADTYQRFSNSLRVAGVSGAAFAAVQDRLFAGAMKNGIAVENLGQLYGSIARASKELGVGQQEILTVTDAVSNSLRVSGQSVESASGALLQLSQAFSAPVIQSQEFNSLLDSLNPLLAAAASASSKYGGSVAKMRDDVRAGKLTSKEFFDLIVAGSATLESQAAKSNLTVAASFTNLQTALIKYMGETDASLGVTRRLSDALALLADNLDVVANSLGIIVVAFTVAMAPAIGRAVIGLGSYAAATAGSLAANIAHTSQLVAKTAGIYGVSRAAAVATVSMRALMSATGIGLAITAVTVALGAFALQSAKSSQQSHELNQRIEEGAAAWDRRTDATKKARQATGDLTAAELLAATKAAALTGETDKLANAHYRAAAAAKAQALETLRLARIKAETDERDAKRKLGGEREKRRIQARAPMEPGSRGAAGGSAMVGQDPSRILNAAAESNIAPEIAKLASDATKAANEARAAEAEEAKRTLDTYIPPAATSTGSGKGKGKSAADIERDSAETIARAERELADAIRAQATTAEDRYRAALEALAEDRDSNVRAIQQRAVDGEITQAAADRLITLEGQTYLAKKEAETIRRNEEVASAQAELLDLRTQTAAEALRIDADELTAKAELATTLAEKQEYERQALAKTQAADDLIFAAEQEALRLRLIANGILKADVEAALAERQANRDRTKTGQTAQQGAEQKDERGPETLDEWAKAFLRAQSAGQSFSASMMDIASQGLSAISDGLVNAIMGAESFSEAMANMAKEVVASLLKIFIQWAMWEAIGLATGNGPGWGLKMIGLGGGSKSGGSKSSASAHIGSNAAGTRFWPGGPTTINEKGDEIITLPTGSQVIPHSVVRQAMSVSGSRAAPVQQITNHIVVQANDAVLTQTVKGWIHEGVVQGMMATKEQVKRDNLAAGRNRLGR